MELLSLVRSAVSQQRILSVTLADMDNMADRLDVKERL